MGNCKIVVAQATQIAVRRHPTDAVEPETSRARELAQTLYNASCEAFWNEFKKAVNELER